MTVFSYRSEKPGEWVVRKLGLHRIHYPDRCRDEGACVIHNPSEHHMLWWDPVFDSSTGLISRFCPDHRIAHPDPDSLTWLISHHRGFRHVCSCRCCLQP